jgi:hypothetical protein
MLHAAVIEPFGQIAGYVFPVSTFETDMRH